MRIFSARVHKTGSTVQIFEGKQLVKEVKASSETFEPAEAKLFANALLKELNLKSAEQMTDTTAEPSIATKAEQHAESTEEVGEQASGADVGAGDNDADLDDLQDEENEEIKEARTQIVQLKKINASLKVALKKEQTERLTERKARRGLAIAQQMVINGSLENTYDVIRSKVAEIVDMEHNEIERLERKVAGESEFETSAEARKEARRQQRLARINRLAAEECQEDGDEDEADQLDQKAEVAEKKASLCLKIAQDMEEEKEETCEAQDEETKDDDKEGEPENLEEKQDEEVKEDVKEETTEEKQDEEKVENVKEEETEETQDEEGEPEDLEKMDDEELKKAMNSSKKKVASKKVAQEEEVKEEPKTEESKDETQDEETDEDLEEKKATARMYRRIASKHRKIAEKKEAQGDTAGADKEDELADDAEEKAEAIETELQDDPMAMEMGTNEEKQDEEVKEDVKEETEEAQDEEVKEEETTEETQDEEVAKEDEEETEKTASVIEGFGFDKSASVEQNEYSNTTEVERLSSMWRGAPKD